jgi:hypothetical protein
MAELPRKESGWVFQGRHRTAILPSQCAPTATIVLRLCQLRKRMSFAVIVPFAALLVGRIHLRLRAPLWRPRVSEDTAALFLHFRSHRGVAVPGHDLPSPPLGTRHCARSPLGLPVQYRRWETARDKFEADRGSALTSGASEPDPSVCMGAIRPVDHAWPAFRMPPLGIGCIIVAPT